MTPQTAAALRALHSEMIYAIELSDRVGNENLSISYVRTWREKLAAVLTQEGAECCGELVAHGRWKDDREVEICAASDSQQFGLYKCDAAPAEPRAAEGAGTYWNNVFGTRTALSKKMNDELNAAAAVPAGGDADLREMAADCRVVAAMPALRGIVTKSCLARIGRAGDFIAQLADSKDAAPAPRGGVTEAWNGLDETAFRQSVLNYGTRCVFASRSSGKNFEQQKKDLEWKNSAFDRVVDEMRKLQLPTPPAAQAQDAGPMARGNCVCDKEVCPTSVTFADGRIVRLAHDADHGYYLEIERES